MFANPLRMKSRLRSTLQPRPILAVAIGVFVFGWSGHLAAQEEGQDPASDTKIIEETLGKIRDIERLDELLAANQQLAEQNKDLQKQIGELKQQVTQLTNELKLENERLRKQQIRLPEFVAKSRVIGTFGAVATIEFGDRQIRLREGLKMTIPIADDAWTLMEVQKITKDAIEIQFPELDRQITIHD